MDGKTKTSITVDEDLWRSFKTKAAEEKGLKSVSEAVEESLREKFSGEIVVKALEELCHTEPAMLEVKPVETCVETSAGEVIRETREEAA